MAFNYNFTLTDGTPLTTVLALESNGTNNLSTPVQIIDIDFNNLAPGILLSGNVTSRFVNAFTFTITGGSPYDGSYTVAGTPATRVIDGKVATFVPLSSAPTISGYTITGVEVGNNGKWVISGPTQGSSLFFPTSVFNVTGNTLPAANGSYTVLSSVTGNQFQVASITTGVGSKFTVLGNKTDFFKIGTTVKLVNTNGHDNTYTINTVSLVGSITEVTTTLAITSGTIITTNTIVVLNTPNTVIVVNGIIPVGAAAIGSAVAAAPTRLLFNNLSPITITPIAPHEYLLTIRIAGDHAAKFAGNPAVQPHNLIYNGTPYASALSIQTAIYNIAGYTELVTNVRELASTTPVISTTDTAGYQDVNFTSISAGTASTGLVPVTTYTTTVTVDGVATPISILGSTAQTFNTLVSQLNTALVGVGRAALDVSNARIRITSATRGGLSSVITVQGTLFAAPLTNFSNISAAVSGLNTSWITLPVPALPYGFVQYTVPTVSSSLQIVGPGSSSFNSTTSWGKAFLNNQLHHLENFKSVTPPVSPLIGQLWFKPDTPVLNLFSSAGWNSVVSTNWPTQGLIDLNNNKIVRLTDAITTFPYVASSTGLGNNDQEGLNLRSADRLYIAKTGGSSAVTSDRSGTLTGSLNINGASPVGHTTIGVNVNGAPVHLYDSASILFKTLGTGSIQFETGSTGGVLIQGSGNLTVGSTTNKIVIQNNTTTAPTATFTTSTTGNAVLNLANNRITNLDTPVNALDAANKAYVDSLVNGIIWIQPVKDPNLFDDSLSTPPVITVGDTLIPSHKTYIVKSPGTGAWAGLDNRAVYYNATTSSWVDILGRNIQVGDRFGVFCEPATDDTLASLPSGGLATKAGKIVTVSSISPIAYTDYVPAEPDAFSVTGSNPTLNALTNSTDRSPHFGHAYTFRGTWGTGGFGTGYKWIEFTGPQVLVDGAGLQYTGNILNVGSGFGITATANAISISSSDLDTLYLRRDGAVAALGNLNIGGFKLTNVSSPTATTDATTKGFTDSTYVSLSGSTLNTSANITLSGGQILGLPTTPTVGGAATSKIYVDNQDALKLSLSGGPLSINANITFSGTGEVLGLPAVPTTAGSATSKAYVDAQISTTASGATVVHLAGIETITGAKTFSAATTLAGSVNVTLGSNVTLSGGTGELLGLPNTPSVGSAATSKTYVDAQVATKAVDGSVVHLAGIETITGAKTFSAATTLNGPLTIAANGTFTNLTTSTTGLSVIGTTVASGGAYSISLTAGQNTGGIGGNAVLIGGAGSTTGGAITLTGGAGSTTGGAITLTGGAGPTAITAGAISFITGNAALLLDPQGVWKINSTAPSAVNQAIVSNALSPTSGAPSWAPIAHRVGAAPVNSGAAGAVGDWFSDDTFFYVYGSTGWRRISASAF